MPCDSFIKQEPTRHDESDHEEFLDPDEVDEEQVLEDNQGTF